MATPVRLGPARWAWLAGGWLAVGLGTLGVVVPGLPTTVFFIVAASCFSRSSPRFERWVLDLPGVGRMVRDHRAGLGMPRRAKVAAIATMAVFAGAGLVLGRPSSAVALVIVALVLGGAAWITWRVPTREVVVGRVASTCEQMQRAPASGGQQEGRQPASGAAGSSSGGEPMPARSGRSRGGRRPPAA